MIKNFLIFFLLCTTISVPRKSLSQALSFLRTPEGIEISEGSSKVLFYQIQPKSLGGKYERSNYVHPLYSLNGQVLTEDFPDDHPHHHGIFWSWHQIIYQERPIADGWTSENISWEVVQSKPRRGKNMVCLDNQILWRAGLGEGDLQPIVREDSRIVVHSSAPDYRIIDFDIRLMPLVDNLKIGGSEDQKGYGGFSWRIKLPDDIRFTTAEKEVQAQTTAVDAGPWLDFYGSLEGDGYPKSGIAVFSHPENPGHPQRWILRNDKSMQNLAFPGRNAIDLPREGLHLMYRVVIHNDQISVRELQKLYNAYDK